MKQEQRAKVNQAATKAADLQRQINEAKEAEENKSDGPREFLEGLLILQRDGYIKKARVDSYFD